MILKQPKLKIMGIEAVKSHQHQQRVEIKIKEALTIIMNKDEDALIEVRMKTLERSLLVLPADMRLHILERVNGLKKYSKAENNLSETHTNACSRCFDI